MQKKIFIKTMGCQMNEYDSNRIYDSVKRLGFEKSKDQNNLDCCLSEYLQLMEFNVPDYFIPEKVLKSHLNNILLLLITTSVIDFFFCIIYNI